MELNFNVYTVSFYCVFSPQLWCLPIFTFNWMLSKYAKNTVIIILCPVCLAPSLLSLNSVMKNKKLPFSLFRSMNISCHILRDFSVWDDLIENVVQLKQKEGLLSALTMLSVDELSIAWEYQDILIKGNWNNSVQNRQLGLLGFVFVLSGEWEARMWLYTLRSSPKEFF